MSNPTQAKLPAAHNQMSFDWLAEPAPAAHGVPTLTAAQLNRWLDDWVAAGWLRSVDRAVVQLIQRHEPTTAPWALLAIVFTSHLAGQGHVCLDLAACWHDADRLLSMPPNSAEAAARRMPQVPSDDLTAEPTGPVRPAHILASTQQVDWLAALTTCSGVIGLAASEVAASERVSLPPLILDGSRLYLRRHWQQEQAVAQAISQRLRVPRALPDDARIQAVLQALFPSDAATRLQPNWQKIACAVALRHSFALITGGPGTGKTTTVVKYLMLTQMLALQAGKPPLRILLCAPTGKAAARLRQSLLSQIEVLSAPFAAAYPLLRAALPDTVDTVHRLIGLRPDQAVPKFHAGNPLPADVVVIDEASMLGLALMANTLAALAPNTQLLLLGDQDQLASVEPGAVLGELSAAALQPEGYSPAMAQWLSAVTGDTVAAASEAPHNALAQATVWLRQSYRFDAASAIAALAECVNTGDDRQAAALLRANESAPAANDSSEPASLTLLRDTADRRPLFAVVLAALSPWLSLAKRAWDAADLSYSSQDDWARAIFAAHQQAQILCALRQGAYGVAGLNAGIEQSLRHAGLLEPAPRPDGWYAGRPVMMTRNDRALNLANGDVGIALPYRDPASEDVTGLRVAFQSDDSTGEGGSGIRWIHPQRLDAVETAFALTVHKAQGSEFNHSLLVLPASPNPVVTRALIYTAITRARCRFTLIAAASDPQLTVLRQAVRRPMRQSGQLGQLIGQVD